MLRKDTQKYQSLVENYCESNSCFKNAKKQLEKYKDELDDAKYHHDSIKLDDEIENWYKSHISMLKTLISFEERSFEHFEEEVKKYGSILEADYNEDLDLLYILNKKTWQA